jgi:phosphohistidine phosphatase
MMIIFKTLRVMYVFIVEEVNSLGIGDNVEIKCVGGGRVNIKDDKKTILVYGYSQGIDIFSPVAFGLCDHSVSCEIIKEQFPDYEITWSNDGY